MSACIVMSSYIDTYIDVIIQVYLYYVILSLIDHLKSWNDFVFICFIHFASTK
jgi:hypothetical protein